MTLQILNLLINTALVVIVWKKARQQKEFIEIEKTRSRMELTDFYQEHFRLKEENLNLKNQLNQLTKEQNNGRSNNTHQ